MPSIILFSIGLTDDRALPRVGVDGVEDPPADPVGRGHELAAGDQHKVDRALLLERKENSVFAPSFS